MESFIKVVRKKSEFLNLSFYPSLDICMVLTILSRVLSKTLLYNFKTLDPPKA